MGSHPRAQSPSSVNKTSQWQLACVFRHAHPAPRWGYKRRAHANAQQFFDWGAETMCPSRTVVVQQLWRRDVMSPFPPSGNEGYTSNRDVPYQSVTFDVTSVWLTNGIPWKTPLLLTPSSALQKPASPPTPVGMEDRTGLRQRWQPLLFHTVGRITLGKCTPSRGMLRSHILGKEVPCGDYTYGVVKGSTTYGSLWGRLSQPGVR